VSRRAWRPSLNQFAAAICLTETARRSSPRAYHSLRDAGRRLVAPDQRPGTRLVERRGFEPPTSAAQAPARLTGSSLPITTEPGWCRTPSRAGLGRSRPSQWRLRGLIGVGGVGEGRCAPRAGPAGPGEPSPPGIAAKPRPEGEAGTGDGSRSACRASLGGRRLSGLPRHEAAETHAGGPRVLELTSVELRFVSRSSTPVRLLLNRLPG
jgi:hypothetical protein